MEDVNVTAPTVFERNGAKSTISALATDNRVILKLSYEISPMSIRSHYDNPKSKLGDVALECYNCGNRNAFLLGFVPAKTEQTVMLLCREPCLGSGTIKEKESMSCLQRAYCQRIWHRR